MSSGVASRTERGQAWQAASMSRWVWTTALGWPVVPDVNAIKAGSSADVVQGAKCPFFCDAKTASDPGSFIRLKSTIVFSVCVCALAMFRSSASVASHSAKLICAFSITSPSSFARNNGMVATAISPAFTTPSQLRAMPIELPPRSSTRLPGTRPKSSVNTCAIRLIRSLVSA